MQAAAMDAVGAKPGPGGSDRGTRQPGEVQQDALDPVYRAQPPISPGHVVMQLLPAIASPAVPPLRWIGPASAARQKGFFPQSYVPTDDEQTVTCPCLPAPAFVFSCD